MSDAQVFLGRPRDILPSILNFLLFVVVGMREYVLDIVISSYLIVSLCLPVPILLSTSSLVIFFVNDIFKTM